MYRQDKVHNIFNRTIENNQFNIGYICTRMQCDAGFADKIAMRWLSKDFAITDYTFADVDFYSNKFANVLRELGLRKGDVFFTFLPKMSEQIFAFLGALKLQLVTGVLFSNFGENALLDRLFDAKAKCIITKRSLLKKIYRIKDKLPCLTYILVVDGDEDLNNQVFSYEKMMLAVNDVFQTLSTDSKTPSVLHYTSGTTGKPKGVLHCHNSILHLYRTAQQVLQLKADDIYWCTADQGWVTGTSYGIIAPWSIGVTQVHFAGVYQANAWIDILEKEQINVWYTAPTALRMLIQEDNLLFESKDLSKLRNIFSVGEPLNPAVISWAKRVLNKEVYDTWFQTETGGIMIANRPGENIKVGSMGKAIDGVTVAVMDDDGVILSANEKGNLCIKVGWESMFNDYLNNTRLYSTKFRNGYYFSGDMVYRDSENYFWFIGRHDDVINTAGHLVSPFEVESVLLEVEEIAEAGVVGIPDELLFEKIIAFVKLSNKYTWSKELELKLKILISNRISSTAIPKEIIVLDLIPKNKSGKIMRAFLRDQYIGSGIVDIKVLEKEG